MYHAGIVGNPHLRLVALWPDGSEAEHREEIDRFLDGQAGGRPEAVLLAEEDSGRVATIDQ